MGLSQSVRTALSESRQLKQDALAAKKVRAYELLLEGICKRDIQASLGVSAYTLRKWQEEWT